MKTLHWGAKSQHCNNCVKTSQSTDLCFPKDGSCNLVTVLCGPAFYSAMFFKSTTLYQWTSINLVSSLLGQDSWLSTCSSYLWLACKWIVWCHDWDCFIKKTNLTNNSCNNSCTKVENYGGRKRKLPASTLPMLFLIVLKTHHQWICTISWKVQAIHE